jgi:serine/threonine protein kinase
MASVYRAYDTHTAEWRAVKILLPEYARRRKLRKRFSNEAQTMIKLDHRHIVKVFDVGTTDELPYIVMELASGGCVIDWVDNYGPMPARMAVDIVMQACKGLKAAHEMGVVHRDVKPHNILVNHRGVCRVTDFGIAQIEDAGGGMTKTGSVMGTLGYMAPEQRADAKNVDVRADVYGLGATLYKLVTGGTVADLFLAEHDAELLTGVPPVLVPVLLKSTAYKPANRYDTVADMARALHKAKNDLEPVPENTPSLVMPISDGAHPAMGTSELSEPTFPGLHDDHSDFSGNDEGTLQPPNSLYGETTDSEKRAILPYVMPNAPARKRSLTDEDDDEIPDYVDTSSIPEAPKGYEIELDDQSKALAEEALRLAIEAGLVDEHGNRINQETVAVSPIHTIDNNWDITGFVQDILESLWSFIYHTFIQPIQTMAIAIGIGLILLVAISGTSAVHVRSAQVEAISTRQTFYLTLEAEQRVLDDLVALGANQTSLNALWAVYANATDEPERMSSAMRLLGQLATTADAASRSKQAASKGHKVHMVTQRLSRIKNAQLKYQQAMIGWEEAADSKRGRMAVRMGIAGRPEE